MRFSIISHGVFPDQLGGMEKHTAFLANGLTRLGHRVEVITPRFKSSAQTTPSANHRFDSQYSQKHFDWPDIKPWLKANYQFSKDAAVELVQDPPDVLYCQGMSGWAFLSHPQRPEKTVTIFNPHGLEMFKTTTISQTLKCLPLRFAARKQARLADRTISLGGYLTEEIRQFLKVPDDKIAVIPNGIELEHVESMMQKPALKLREKGHLTQFLFVGRLEPNKGVHNLCNAFKNIRGARLIIVGGGSLEEQLRVAYAGKNIYFTGAVDERKLFALYQQSDCFLFSSLYEGMPTVILEAMAASLPVLSTDIGAVSSMVDEQNGIIFKPGSVSAIINAIDKFLAMPEQQKQDMGKESLRRVKMQFTWDQIARKTERLVEKVAKENM